MLLIIQRGNREQEKRALDCRAGCAFRFRSIQVRANERGKSPLQNI